MDHLDLGDMLENVGFQESREGLDHQGNRVWLATQAEMGSQDLKVLQGSPSRDNLVNKVFPDLTVIPAGPVLMHPWANQASGENRG
jgi:hypothetical protein